MNTPRIVLKANNVQADEHCAICGEWTETAFGMEMFLEEGFAVVCGECGKEHAPVVKAARDILHEEANFKRQYPGMFADDAAKQWDAEFQPTTVTDDEFPF